jgi:hypothetical protein
MTRSLVRQDPFSGEARPRLRTIARDLDAVITDAQSRDWSADRPDRVIFARLAQARDQVRTAAGARTTSDPAAGARTTSDPTTGTRTTSGPAAGTRTTSGPAADRTATVLGAAVGFLAAVGLLMTVTVTTGPGGPAIRPLPLALTAVAGLWAGLLAGTALRRLQRRRDRVTSPVPAPIDDHYRYAAFRRRIETCAVTARNHRSHRRRAAAIDLEYALDWLAAAQNELPRR